MSNRSYDLIVIGSGTAATVVAMGCRKAGWSVALIDHRPFGGTCARCAAVTRRRCWWRRPR